MASKNQRHCRHYRHGLVILRERNPLNDGQKREAFSVLWCVDCGALFDLVFSKRLGRYSRRPRWRSPGRAG